MTYKWSSDRPSRPTVDPLLASLRAKLMMDNRSTYAKANVSGLAPATIKRIEDDVTRHPQSTTVQMAYAMLGYRLQPMPNVPAIHIRPRKK